MSIAFRQSLWKASCIKKVRYVKFTVNSIVAGDFLQISRLELLRQDSSYFDWPTSVTFECSCPTAGWSASESPTKMLDHSVYTKMGAYTCTFPIDFVFDVGENAIFFTKDFEKWQWWTANDTATWSGRNPTSFSLSFSQDGQKWTVIDSVDNYSPPAQNYTLGYEGSIVIH